MIANCDMFFIKASARIPSVDTGVIPLDPEAAAGGRDSLAKSVYGQPANSR